ncbi:WD40/YVTN/BNR-like repeat-containing protein [Ferruginibacter sp.]
MKKNLLIIHWLLLVQLSVSNAQQADAVLRQQLQGKQSLTEIMNTVKQYYKNPQTINRVGVDAVNRSLKHWSRYEWYMSSRLGPNGEFVNINQKMINATGMQQRGVGNIGNGIESSTAIWSAVGPLNTDGGIGRVDRLAFHPTDADIVYAGTTAGGLWRTTDAGTNWTNLTPDIPTGGISGILIDPVNTNTLYVLTGDGDSDFGGLVEDYGYMRLSIGVLKSTNGGSTWTKMGNFPGVDYSRLVGYRLTMHPTDNNILYACTNQGLFISLTAGATWGLVNGTGRFFNLQFRPGSGTVCYAVGSTFASGSTSSFSRALFWRSTTSGLTWDTSNVINNQINNPTRRVELAVAPTNSNLVYLLAGGVPGNGPANPVPNLFKGLLLSIDGGLSFGLQSNSPNILGRSNTGTDTIDQSNYDLTIAVSNSSSSTVITGAVEVWRSLNSGNTWTFRGGLHDDVHYLGFHPVDNKLWAATDGGVYSSIDNGINWTSHFEDMNITQFYRMAVNPDDYTSMIAGAQDNAVKRRNGGTSYFDEIASADGFAVGYDVANPDTMFAVTNRSISRSYNGGNNFTNITPANSSHPFSMAMAVHTSISNALFIGSDSMWRTTNGGNSWAITGSLTSGWFIRTCPSNGNRVYAAGGNSFASAAGFLFRSDDGGVNWLPENILSNNPGFPNSYPKITCINVDPNNSNNVWVTFGGFTDGVKVYFSNNAGDTWSDRSGTLPNVPVNCIALDINNNAYIGTDNGVYYRGAGSSDWVPFYNNLPYVPVTELIITESENRIRASTFGRGIWSSDLYSTCVTDLNLTGTLEGQEFHEASNNIVSTSSLLTSEGTKVQMRAGNEVLLQAGFTARETTQFRAAIGPCGSGGVAGFRFSTVDSFTLLPASRYLMPANGRMILLHIASYNNAEANVKLTIKQPGEVQLILTDREGKILQQKNSGTMSKGEHETRLSLAGATNGLFYLHVLLNNRWEHIQEINL